MDFIRIFGFTRVLEAEPLSDRNGRAQSQPIRIAKFRVTKSFNLHPGRQDRVGLATHTSAAAATK